MTSPRIVLLVLLLSPTPIAVASEPWVITTPVEVTSPVDVGDVIVASGRRLVVRDLPEPGLRVTGNLVALGDGEIRLERSVIDSHLGEVLTMERGIALLERTLVDGSGGFVGARDSSLIVANRCTFTCTVEAAHDATIRLHDSMVEPYPVDPTGQWTRFGAYDRGRLLADQTPVLTRPELGGQGLIAVSYLVDPPSLPPAPGAPVTLFGIAAQYSLDPDVAPGRWALQALPAHSRHPRLLASGTGNVEEEPLATWENAAPTNDYQLRLVLVDGWGRTLVGRHRVPGTGVP